MIAAYLPLKASFFAATVISQAGQQLGSYEFVEPADYDGVTTLAGSYLTLYFPNHILRFSKLSSYPTSLSAIQFSHLFTGRLPTPHYKTVVGLFPEKQLL
jgi:hypothetical protein